ncbi:MAG: NFACT RNA binding domain-containing protein [Tissierellia bacterium]|nr:NFACT RNA binding domain-containing protein [Tissierellia bacterium]
MAFDGIVTGAVVSELNDLVIGARIDKIYQPLIDEIHLFIRTANDNIKLCISSSSHIPRIYIDETETKNPLVAPQFSMVLRKHLQGGRILAVSQIQNDRVIKFEIENHNEFLELEKKFLWVEIMGKYSNIILTNSDMKIIDSIKRVPASMSRIRQILPGQSFKLLDNSDRLNPIDCGKNEFIEKIENSPQNLRLDKFFYTRFIGFSPLIGKEISNRAKLEFDMRLSALNEFDKEAIWIAFQEIAESIKNKEYKFLIYYDKDSLVDFHVLDIKYLNCYEKKEFDSIFSLINNYYLPKAKRNIFDQKAKDMKRAIAQKIEKSQNKLTKLYDELDEAKNRKIFKIYGDLLSSNLHLLNKNKDFVILENFYSDNLDKIEIPLDEKISPARNAEKYYKKYSKLKFAEKYLKTQIEETKGEIAYLDSVMTSINLADDLDHIENLRSELVSTGYLKKQSKKKTKPVKEKYTEYISDDGIKILVGRSNRQNDILTFKIANRNHIWLHAKDIPGSHVIISDFKDNISENTLQFAADLAAKYSKASNTGAVDVDYTLVKFVKKHPANKPGLVIYTDFKTITGNSNIEI